LYLIGAVNLPYESLVVDQVSETLIMFIFLGNAADAISTFFTRRMEDPKRIVETCALIRSEISRRNVPPAWVLPSPATYWLPEVSTLPPPATAPFAVNPALYAPASSQSQWPPLPTLPPQPLPTPLQQPMQPPPQQSFPQQPYQYPPR
jgi:hypothetical protein